MIDLGSNEGLWDVCGFGIEGVDVGDGPFGGVDIMSMVEGLAGSSEPRPYVFVFFRQLEIRLGLGESRS